MSRPPLPPLSSPLFDKPMSGLLLKSRPELSSPLRTRLKGNVLPPSLNGDSEEDKGNKGYASQKGLRHKIVFGSEDEDED